MQDYWYTEKYAQIVFGMQFSDLPDETKRKIFSDRFRQLPEKLQRIVRLRTEGVTQKTIAEKDGVSATWIWSQERTAFRKMRAGFKLETVIAKTPPDLEKNTTTAVRRVEIQRIVQEGLPDDTINRIWEILKPSICEQGPPSE